MPTPYREDTCPRCQRSTGRLEKHMTTCHPPSTAEAMEAAIVRAGAHATDNPRAMQRWRHAVTDLEVARVMRCIEAGTRLYRSATGRWFAPTGTPLYGMRHRVSIVVHEMIRTGLLRHYKDREGDHLLPAPVHVRNPDNPALSACLFVGEDMGPMRSRLVDDLTLVDCLVCESAVSTGLIRGL